MGDWGVILSTTNGGSTWTQQSSGTNQPLFSVYFTSSTTGFTVGNNGIILGTTDGGATWTSVVSGTTLPLNDIYFSSATDGWIVGESIILKTTDGGTTWTNPFTDANLSIRSVNFFSATEGWAVGQNYGGGSNASILTTSDGGVTWTPQVSPVSQPLYDVHFTSATNGCAVGENGTILRTTNGGANWVSASGPYSSLYDVHFTSGTDGWAVGLYGTILSTSDGGTTWNQESTGINRTFYSIHFVSSSLGWIAGIGTILNTQDAGINWTEQYSGSGRDFWGVDFSSASNGWAVGYEASVLHTSNGGTDWSRQLMYGSFWALDVDFINDTLGWVVGTQGAMRKTVNGGNDWTTESSGTTEELLGLQMLSDTDGWAVGNSVITHTDDGSSWGVFYTSIGDVFKSVYFTDPLTGFVVGYNGLLIKTVDGGLTWSTQNLGSIANFNRVFFVSPTHGWIVGTGGTIYATEDGGATWELQYPGTNADLYAVQFISPEQGWITGYNKILVTSNGGETWVLQQEGLGEMTDICMIDASHGTIVGVNGKIKQFDCSMAPIQLVSYSLPSSDGGCTGSLAINATGNSPFTSTIDGATPIYHAGNYTFEDLCPGQHNLIVSDACGNQDSLLFIIPIDSNYVENDPFGNSIGLDSIGAIIEDCFIIYNSIDTAYIESLSANNDTVTVVWNITDVNGPHLDTAVYLLVNGNGIYWLQLSAFCPTKALGDYFTVSEAIDFEGGTVSIIHQNPSLNFTLYPNPTNELATIQFEGSVAQLTIRDAQGKLISTSNISSGAILSLKDVQTGIYFFELETELGKTVKRVVKN